MAFAVLVGELRLLALQIAELALQLLDVLVAEHRRERVDRRRALDGLQLVVERFLLDARRLRLRHRAVQVGEPLDDDVLAILDGDGVVRLLEVLERGLALLDLLALLGQLLAEPVGRVLRGGERELEVLLDVRLATPLAMSAASCGSRRREAQLHDAGCCAPARR